MAAVVDSIRDELNAKIAGDSDKTKLSVILDTKALLLSKQDPNYSDIRKRFSEHCINVLDGIAGDEVLAKSFGKTRTQLEELAGLLKYKTPGLTEQETEALEFLNFLADKDMPNELKAKYFAEKFGTRVPLSPSRSASPSRRSRSPLRPRVENKGEGDSPSSPLATSVRHPGSESKRSAESASITASTVAASSTETAAAMSVTTASASESATSSLTAAASSSSTAAASSSEFATGSSVSVTVSSTETTAGMSSTAVSSSSAADSSTTVAASSTETAAAMAVTTASSTSTDSATAGSLTAGASSSSSAAASSTDSATSSSVSVTVSSTADAGRRETKADEGKTGREEKSLHDSSASRKRSTESSSTSSSSSSSSSSTSTSSTTAPSRLDGRFLSELGARLSAGRDGERRAQEERLRKQQAEDAQRAREARERQDRENAERARQQEAARRVITGHHFLNRR